MLVEFWVYVFQQPGQIILLEWNKYSISPLYLNKSFLDEMQFRGTSLNF